MQNAKKQICIYANVYFTGIHLEYKIQKVKCFFAFCLRPTKRMQKGVVSSLDFECTACNTKVLTTGSGCPTKSLESKFGFGKAKFGGKAWLDVVGTGGTLQVPVARSKSRCT